MFLLLFVAKGENSLARLGDAGITGGAIVFRDGVFQGRFRCDQGLHLQARHLFYPVDYVPTARIDHRHRQNLVEKVKGHHPLAASEIGGNQPEHRRLDPEIVEVDGRHTELVAEKTDEVVGPDRPHADEVVAETAPAGFLFLEGSLQHLLAHEAGFKEQIAYPFPLFRAATLILQHSIRFLPFSLAR